MPKKKKKKFRVNKTFVYNGKWFREGDIIDFDVRGFTEEVKD